MTAPPTGQAPRLIPAPTAETAQALLEESRSYFGVDDVRAGLLLEQAASIARGTRDQLLLADVLNGLAYIEHTRGNSHAALFHLHEALELRRTARDRNGEAGVLCNLGNLYTDLGNHNTALEHLLQALGVVDEQNDPVRAAILLANLARVYDLLGHDELAQEHYEMALRRAREQQQHAGELILCVNFGDFERRRGRFEQAEALLKHAVDHAGSEGAFAAGALQALGLLHRDRQELNDALDVFASASRLAHESSDLDTVLEVTLNEAETLLQCRNPAWARNKLEEGIRIAESSGRHRMQARLLHLLTDTLEQLDEPALALSTARQANHVHSGVLMGEADRRTRQLTTQHELERAKRELEVQRQKYDAQREAKEQLEREAAARLLELERKALYDALTGLPNRLLLADRFRVALDHAAQHGTRIALGVIDLNKFKHINDTLGHHVGDQLLIEVARRLEPVVDGQDTVARTGGDEFVLLIRDVEHEQAVMQVARRVLEAFERVFALAGQELNVRPSIGFAVYPKDALTYEALFEHADKAMYEAKVRGSGFEIHGHLHSGRLTQVTLEGALHQALGLQQFSLVYQPQTLCDGRVRGAETFLRWQHPHFGNVPPADFLPLAEGTGLGIPIGAWVLGEACREATRWGDRIVSVNLSGRQFAHPSLRDVVRQALEVSGLPPHLLELEVNEEMLAQHPQRARSTLRDLKTLGVRVVIDDFGSGFTRFAALKHDPVDGVKIDQALVKDLHFDDHSGRDEALVTAVVRMAQALKLDVIAEGVENERQRQFLMSLGVTAVQGFVFSHPQAPKALQSWLQGR